MTKNLIVNADDFGVSAGVNRAILESHEHGVVTSASLMVDRPASGEAAAIIRRHPDLSIGLHWDGGGEGIAEVDLGDEHVVRQEFQRQLDLFQRLVGRLPTHVDSEAHVHRDDSLMPLFQELVGPLRIPLRGDGRVRFEGGFYGQWEYMVTNVDHISVAALTKMLEEEVIDGWTEFSCHPGYPSPEHSSVYETERTVEVQTLTDGRICETLRRLGIRLVSYADYLADREDAEGAGAS